MEFSLNPRSVAKLMLIIIAILSLMHITQLIIYFYIGNPEIFDFIEPVDFDYESNFPSFYSSIAILFCATLLWVIGHHKQQNRFDYRYHWIGLAIIFTFLSMDEAIALHEDIGNLVEEQEWFEAKGFLYFSWVVPYGLLLIVFSLSYLKFVFSLPRPIMVKFISAGILFITGAVGIEVISASEADLHGTKTIYYSVLYTVEELCEMIAMVIFSYALLCYIEGDMGTIKFRVHSEIK